MEPNRPKADDLATVRSTFETLGATDPLWAVLTDRRYKNNRWDPEAFFETGRLEIRSLVDYLDGLKLTVERGRALDFGCAVGRLTQPLCEYFDSVVGVDIAQSFLKLANDYNRFGDRCRYLHNDRSDLRLLESESFDFIYSSITLQHMPPQCAKQYVSEFFRLLRPGGVAVFQIPGGWRPFDGTFSWCVRRLRWAMISPLRRVWKKALGRPIIGMHGTARREVEETIAASGGRLIDVLENQAAGSGWLSFRYCAMKG